MVYVLCSSHRRFQDFCHMFGVHPVKNKDFRSLVCQTPEDINRLRGAGPNTLIMEWGDLYREGANRMAYREILHYARCYNMAVIDVPEPGSQEAGRDLNARCRRVGV